jgi:hypothetical protein
MYYLVLLLLLALNSYSGQSLQIPERGAGNLLITSFAVNMSNKSDFENLKLVEIVRIFDVCGFTGQVSISGLKGMATLLQNREKKKWGYMYSSMNAGDGDTLAEFGLMWRKDRVKLTGLMPTYTLLSGREYQRDPLCVFLSTGGKSFTFILVSIDEKDKSLNDIAADVDMVVEAVKWSRAFWDERDILVAGYFGIKETEEQLKHMAKLTRLARLEVDGAVIDSSGEGRFTNHMFATSRMSSDRDYVFGPINIFSAVEFFYGDISWENSLKYEKEISYHLPIWVELKENE